jgi:methylated-DNA-[protein]-cysteine S-methyltransferase
MSSSLTFSIDRLPSPIGSMLIVADAEERLRALDWDDHESRMRAALARLYAPGGIQLREGRAPRAIRHALEEYLEGRLEALDDIPVETAGTRFQLEVWRALRRIRPGTTLTYRALALAVGRPDAVRAVGLANGTNPISVVVPCHRVIGSNGSLTGYGGGLHRKRWLLEHEGALPVQLRMSPHVLATRAS